MGRRIASGELKRPGQRAFDFDQRQVTIRIGSGDAFDFDAVAIFIEHRQTSWSL